MDYFEGSEYSLSREDYYCNESKKKRLLTLGLPLGSALVLIALLNTVFTLKSILSFVDVVIHTGIFTAKNHLIYVVIVSILFILTVYLWVAVIFTGRGYHLSIWIAGSVLLLLLKVVITTWTLIQVLSSKDTLYWRKFWALVVDIGMEMYLIAVAVVTANVMWRREDQQRMSQFSAITRGSLLPIPPIGLWPKQFLEFYQIKNVQLSAKIFILLDVIYSSYIITTEKIPELILTKEFQLSPSIDLVDNTIVQIVDSTMHLSRIIFGLLAIVVLMRVRQTPRRLLHILVLQLVLASLSMIIYLCLFAHFEELSVTDRFYQVEFTGEIVLRFVIIGCLIKSVENKRLQEEESIQIIEFCR